MKALPDCDKWAVDLISCKWDMPELKGVGILFMNGNPESDSIVSLEKMDITY